MDPYDYLVGKLAQIEMAIEDEECVADTPHDYETIASLRTLEVRLLDVLEMLEREQVPS